MVEQNMTGKTADLSAIRNIQLNEQDFRQLPLADQQSYLEQLPPRERLTEMLNAPNATQLARVIPTPQFYRLFKELDSPDATKLLGLASPEQSVFILDMELWRGWSFQGNKAVKYLAHIMQGSEQHFLELLPHLDFNFLTLLLGKELLVTGGIGDLNSDEEFQGDWDQTFDDVFLIKYKNPRHARIIGVFLQLLCRYDYRLYTALMESVSAESDIESEEECHRVKSGRLADLGFPPPEVAREIYSRINPNSFTPSPRKELLQSAEATLLPELYLTGQTFLERVIPQVDSQLFRSELNYLVNTALIADEAHLAGMEQMKSVVERLYGYLNIALEHLSEGDHDRGVAILGGEYLKRLFQLGFSLVINLKIRAEKLDDPEYATGKALSGLKSSRPRFYRGLDSDAIDDYREFRELRDVMTVSVFLSNLEGSADIT